MSEIRKNLTNEDTYLREQCLVWYGDMDGEGGLEVEDFGEFLRLRVVRADEERQDAIDLDPAEAWRLAVHLLEALGPR